MRLRTILGVTLMVLACAPLAQAADLAGDLSMTGRNVTQDGADLAVSSLIKATGMLVTSPGTGDYSGIDFPTEFKNGSFVTLDLNNLSGFTFSNSSFGTFVANGTGNQILQRSASVLLVYLRGTFTPSGSLSSFSPTDTSVRLSINQNGSSISEALSLTSPAVVPEPSTWALAALSAGTLAWASRRRKARTAKA